MITKGERLDADQTWRCEVCVIGSGAGGAVVAKELAEAGRDVIVLEQGGYYTKEDFRKGGARYDLILDNVGDHSMAATRRALTPNGVLLSNGGGHAGGALGRVIRLAIVSMFVRQQGKPSPKFENRADLLVLKDLVEAGKIAPVIDAAYPLRETRRAIAHVAAGHARGTVVIAIDRAAA